MGEEQAVAPPVPGKEEWEQFEQALSDIPVDAPINQLEDLWKKLQHAIKARDEFWGIPLLDDECALQMAPQYPHKALHGATEREDKGVVINGAAEDAITRALVQAMETEGAKSWTDFIGPDEKVDTNEWLQELAEVIKWKQRQPKRWVPSRNLYYEIVQHKETGRVQANVFPVSRGKYALEMLMDTGKVATLLDPAAEEKAMAKLATLIKPQQFNFYKRVGAFLITSKRSGVAYMFRRLRPTIALRADEHGVKFLAALCLHTLGYYSGTFCGVMAPTDDILTHLLLMQGDERTYWKSCEQHSIDDPHSGLN